MGDHTHNFEEESRLPMPTVGDVQGGPLEIAVRARKQATNVPQTASTGTAMLATPPGRIDKSRRFRKLLLAGATILAGSSSGYFVWDYWEVGRFQVSTDDAYVQADNITIAPKISGYIGEVVVGDNERIKSGQALARIDDRDFRVGLFEGFRMTASSETAPRAPGPSFYDPLRKFDQFVRRNARRSRRPGHTKMLDAHPHGQWW